MSDVDAATTGSTEQDSENTLHIDDLYTMAGGVGQSITADAETPDGGDA